MASQAEYRQVLAQKPTDRRRLCLWVKVFLDFDIHQTVRCTESCLDEDFVGRPPHNSQLDYIAQAFFNEYRNGVVLAARGAGKSFCAAIVDFLDCLFKPGIWIANVAWKQEQTDYIYNYLERFIEAVKKKTGLEVAKVRSKEIKFQNGSLISFYSGNSKGNVKGAHPDVLRVDEGDLFTEEEFRGIANALRSGGKYPPRFDLLSTNYKMSGEGVIVKQIQAYQEYNRNKPDHLAPHAIFRICLKDILQKCDDRFVCYDEKKGTHCPLWGYCKGIAKEGEGFYPIEDALAILSAGQSKANFESEMLLLRPTAENAYFWNFDHQKNVGEFELQEQWESYILFDFGGGRCPTAVLVIQRDPGGSYWVVDEWQSMGYLETLIAKVKAKYPTCTDWNCFYDPAGDRKEKLEKAISCKTALKRAGFFPRSKGNTRRTPSAEQLLGLIQGADGRVRFRVNKRCRHTIDQISSAEHKFIKGKITDELKDAGDNGGDEFLDLCRYCVAWTMKPNGQDKRSHQPRFF